MVRGDVYEIRLPRGRGHVQHGRRYAVVVQSSHVIGMSTTLICPTSTSVRPASFRPDIEIDGQPTRVLCEQVCAVDTRTLTRHVGHLTTNEMTDLDIALELVLDLGR